MSESAIVLAERLKSATEPGSRQRLAARGLARGMIWRNGRLPEGAPPFGATLTTDLLDHGYAILALALRLRDTGEYTDVAENACRVAAEAIESAIRKGDTDDAQHGFHLVIAAAAFHIGHFAARAYCILPEESASLNLSSPERALVALIRRSLTSLRSLCFEWLVDEGHQDAAVVIHLQENIDFHVEDVVAMAITRNFHRAIGLFESAIQNGSPETFAQARELLIQGTEASEETRFVPLWWINTIARHLLDDLWSQSLHQRLPVLPNGGIGAQWNSLRDRYIASLVTRNVANLDLWPSQIEAARRAIDPDDDLIVALPTSAGKTRIAELCILRTIAAGKRVVYVTPLRALSAQLERVLARTFRPLGISVSALYGASGVAAADIGSLQASTIVVATPEKLDFAIRQQPTVLDDVGLVVLDEGHMIGLGTREVRYEVLVQRLLKRADATSRRIVCLSAIFSAGEAFNDFTAWIRSDRPGDAIHSTWRPTRQRPAILSWSSGAGRLDLIVDEEKPFVPRFVQPIKATPPRQKDFPNTLQELVMAAARVLVDDNHRVLIYCPQRTSVESLAKVCLTLARQGMLPHYLKDAALVKRAKRIGIEWLGANHVAVKALELGIAVHHGALPRPFLTEIEFLLNDKILPIAIASPTLAQGIDLSCSALIFQSIYRSGNLIKPDEFANVIGRAGRAFVDLDGITVFPIFDAARATAKRRDFVSLRRNSETRHMQSGILLLVAELAERLSSQLNVRTDGLIEYVMNQNNSWILPESQGSGDEREDGQPFEELLADLDTMILATVDRLDCTTEELADALDEALKGSLWNRRLARHDERGRKLQQAILHGRARWIWSKSNSKQRQGYFAAGIGFGAGSFIDSNLDRLIGLLTAAEAAIATASTTTLIESVAGMAEMLFRVYPFDRRKLPQRWKVLLDAWIKGLSLGEVISADDASEEIEFIQQGIVFQLVWAVEAVRVHAVATGRLEATRLSGAVAMILTYGVPNVACALLAEAGIPSRPMIIDLIKTYNGEFSDGIGLRIWLVETISKVKRDKFWKTDDAQQEWKEFVESWHGKSQSAWGMSNISIPATWIPSYMPVAGQTVRLIHDTSTGRTHVCGEDLELIGTLDRSFSAAQTGHVKAVINASKDQIMIARFGP